MKGTTPTARAEAVQKENDEELDLLESELSTESESSEEESPPSEQEVEEEETKEEVVEEPKGEEPTEEPATEPEEESDDVPEDVRQLSPKAQKRFRDLAAKNKLQAEQIEQAKKVSETFEDINTISPSVDLTGREEVTEDDYKSDIAKQADFVVNRRITQYEQKQKQKETLVNLEKTTKNFNEDLSYLEKTYPELNPDNDTYDNELDEFIGDYYDKVKDTTRLKEVADKIMKQRNKSIEVARKDNVDKVAKQASQQAIKPSGDLDTSSNVEDKIKGATTIEELEELEREL